jgi:UDP-MurNAc hydroxylase
MRWVTFFGIPKTGNVKEPFEYLENGDTPMKVTKYGSATILIETRDGTILCDPWLSDGVYYGAWCNYPPINMADCDFSNVDYVYISHIHPDHFDPKTMELLDKSTTVLIHKYHQGFLKAAIQRLGFSVVELENGAAFDVSKTTKLSIFAADDCDPSICGNMFGCITSEIKGSMQLDSLCVIDDGQHILVNTNDCPYLIAEKTLKRIKTIYPKIDFALVGYTSASLFPHCMMDYDDEQMATGMERAKRSGLTTGLNTLKLLQPTYYLPFAGTYILGGPNHAKNAFLPVPEIQDAVTYFQNDPALGNSNPILLNFGESFSLETQTQTAPYIPIDVEQRKAYIANTASKFTHSYESEDTPTPDALVDLFIQATERLKRKQKEIGFAENLNLVFDISDEQFACINLLDSQVRVIDDLDVLENYHRFQLDPRLLKLALMGPRFVNWNNLEIGALLNFARKPDVYRMDAHILINALHV